VSESSRSARPDDRPTTRSHVAGSPTRMSSHQPPSALVSTHSITRYYCHAIPLQYKYQRCRRRTLATRLILMRVVHSCCTQMWAVGPINWPSSSVDRRKNRQLSLTDHGHKFITLSVHFYRTKLTTPWYDRRAAKKFFKSKVLDEVTKRDLFWGIPEFPYNAMHLIP